MSTTTTHRRLWRTAGALTIGWIVLTFVGSANQPQVLLGDPASKVREQLVNADLTKAFGGGYVEFLATLLLLAAGTLYAALLRTDGPVGQWLSSLSVGSLVAHVAATMAVGFPAGAAALYDGQHGASIDTVTAVNDIRNFAFFLSGGLLALFVIGTCASVLVSRRLPRWVALSGLVVAALELGTIPAAGHGVFQLATLASFAWLVALGVAAFRQSGGGVEEHKHLAPAMA
jgi:hypothetical protein